MIAKKLRATNWKYLYQKAKARLQSPAASFELTHLNERITSKVKLKDNTLINDAEFTTASALCDIIAEVIRVGNSRYPGGIFWGDAQSDNAHTIHLRKNRKEIDVSMLLNNRFRDFPTIIYEHDALTPKPDYWVRRYIRLCRGIQKQWHIQTPKRFGEIGWNVNGFPVNRHTAFLQERINTQIHLGMENALSISEHPRILEIGGGSGEMAYAICKNTPNATWYDCDLPSSLIYNAIHMAVWLPNKKHYIYIGNLPVENINETYVLRSAEEAAQVKDAVVNIPHFLLDDFNEKLPLNFALNAWSFSEMPASEVKKYGMFIKNNLLPKGMLIEQNGTHADKGGCNAKEILKQIFPKKRSFKNPPLSAHGIAGGAIDAWSLNDLVTSQSVILDCFSNGNDVDDLHYSGEHFGLLKF